MDSGIKLIVIVSVAAAVAAALWHAIRKQTRKIADHQREKLAPQGANSEDSSFKATSESDAVGGISTHPVIEAGAAPPETNLGGNGAIRSAGHRPVSESPELQCPTNIAPSYVDGVDMIPEIGIDQTADAPASTSSGRAGAICAAYPDEQLTDAPLRAADADSLPAVLNEPEEGIVSLQDIAAGETTSQVVPLTTISDGQVSAGPPGVGEQVSTAAYVPEPQANVVPEHLDFGAAIVPNALLQVGICEADAQVETDSVSTGHMTRSEENTVPEGPEAIEVESTVSQPRRAGMANKAKRPPKYQPSIRVGEATLPTARIRVANESITDKVQSFSVFLHIVFDRRNRYRISLLPARNEEVDKIVRVDGPNGEQSWSASQDEWFGDMMPANLGMLLEQGSVWQSVQDPPMQWVLSGREIYVLAQNSTISAFVSTSRLSLDEDHLVLVSKRLEDAARKALSAAGCSNMTVIDGERGVPFGWVLFRNVRPTVAVLHESEAGILNILRPVHVVEIVFRGGIRLAHANWLRRHPPQIRLKGATDGLEVLIDGQRATDDGRGNFQATGWNEPRKHTVFCGGVTQSYGLVDGLEEWKPFEAFVYQPAWGERGPSVAICGPLVMSPNQEETLLLSTLGNTCLLGSVPGQIVVSPPRYNATGKEFLAIADFPVVWALPAASLQCDRSAVKIRLVSPHSPNSTPRSLTKVARKAALRWCYAILESSYKRLDVEPGTGEVKTLWQEYKNEAHRLKRLLR